MNINPVNKIKDEFPQKFVPCCTHSKEWVFVERRIEEDVYELKMSFSEAASHV
jgi:hypothetical protein